MASHLKRKFGFTLVFGVVFLAWLLFNHASP